MQIHKLKAGGNYEVFTFRSAKSSCTAELLHDLPQGNGEESSTYAFDPESGVPLREYLFPKDLGWGLACTDGEKFTFLVANNENKNLSLVELAGSGVN